MKTKSLFKIAAVVAVIFCVSCSKDSSSSDTGITALDAKTSSKIDQASNDVADIVEEQEANTYVNASTGKTADISNSMLSDCAYVTRVPAFGTAPTVGQTVTKTIDFSHTSAAGCTLANGTNLKGKIIITFVYDPSATSHTITYSFDGFYHNDNLIQGNKTITRTWASSSLLATPHPIHSMSIDMTVTFANGDVYTRVGTRTRECVEHFDNDNLNDNIYKLYGTVTTTKPNGVINTNTVTEASPLRIEMNCQYRIVSGIITITRPNHTAVLDYGTGNCDNSATISIDGGAPVAFTFGN